MFKLLRNLLIVLTFLVVIFINKGNAQPFLEPEDEVESVFTWKPESFDVKLGDYDLTVWYLQPQVSAPIGLYGLKREDWIEIRRRLKSLKSETDRIKQRERRLCDEETDRLKIDFKKRQDILFAKVNNLEDENKKWDGKLKELQKEYFWFKVGSGVVLGTVTGFSVYYALSK